MINPTRDNRPILVLGMIVAATAIGFAIQLHDGEYSPGAMGLVTLAIFAVAAGIATPGVAGLGARLSSVVERLRERWTRRSGRPSSCSRLACQPYSSRARDRNSQIALIVALAIQGAALWIAWPGVDLPHQGARQLLPLRLGLLAAAGLICMGAWGKSAFLNRIWFPLLVCVFAALGFWMVRSSPHPHIDVWVFQLESARELLRGHDPYAMTFPDIYHTHQQVYGTGLVADHRLLFGFPYPPVSLLLATLGYLLGGDHRYAQVAALALAGLFIGYSVKSRTAMLAAALLLFTPRVFFVLGRAWTEPFVVMLLAATIFCAARRSRGLAVALGLFLATKQYLIFAVPFTFFLLPAFEEPGRWRREWIKLLAKAGAVAAIVTLPFVIWNAHAFWRSTVTVQEMAPFRWDALSYLVWFGFRKHLVTAPSTAIIWSTLAALIALAIALWRSPRTAAGFAASLALLSLGFFAFNKQAFCNYYFFVIGALCSGVAAAVTAV